MIGESGPRLRTRVFGSKRSDRAGVTTRATINDAPTAKMYATASSPVEGLVGR